MSLELIKKFLKDNGKDSPELSESHIDSAIESAREAEKIRYIAEAKKIRLDIDKLKPYKQALEDVGFDGTVDLPDFISSLKKVKESAKEGPAKTELEKQVTALSNQLKAMATEHQAVKERELSLQKERKTAIIKERLMKDIGEKLAGGEAYVKSLLYESAVDLDDDGKTIVFKNGDVVTPYETGIKTFLKEHEGDLKDNQKPGAGSSSNSTRPVNVHKDMPLSDMMKLR